MAGQAVGYHEFGHLISSAFKDKDISAESRKTYQDIKTCLTNMNPNTANNISDVYTDKLTGNKTAIPISAYAEEDFADLISAVTGKNSDKSLSLNVGCLVALEV